MKVKRIPVVSGRGLSPRAYRKAYGAGDGTPVILADVVDRWPAASRWDFDFLRTRTFKRSLILASAPQCEGSGHGPEDLCTAAFTVADYIRYVVDPTRRPGCTWLQGSWERVEALGIPLYAGNVDLLSLPGGKDLLEDLEVRCDFMSDWSRWLPRRLLDRVWRCRTHFYLYVSAPGALTPLHYDFWDSHAYLAQIRGEKECVLFGPRDSEAIHHGEIDPERPDFARYPRLQGATAWTGRLRAGQMLVLPSRWWHHVRTLTPSITFSYNWFDGSNWGPYLRAALLSGDGIRRLASTSGQPPLM